MESKDKVKKMRIEDIAKLYLYMPHSRVEKTCFTLGQKSKRAQNKSPRNYPRTVVITYSENR